MDASSSGNGGSQSFDMTLPAKVVLASYSGHRSFNVVCYYYLSMGVYAEIGGNAPWWNGEDSIDWTYQSGGEDSGYDDNSGGWDIWYLLWPYGFFDWDDILQAGENGFTPDNEAAMLFYMGWENASYSGSYGAGVAGGFNDDTQTRVMIKPQGQVAAGTMVTYLVQAQAWNKIDGTQLPPDSMKIQGVPLTASTNTDGSVWGNVFLTVPAGATPDVTPMASGSYSFGVQASEISVQLAVDANRDGDITFDAADQTSANNPYRFWVNDNHDGYGNIWNLTSIDSVQEDLDPSTGNDATSNTISCTRDLEDYTRLWINTTGLTTELQNGTLQLALEWEDVTTGDPQIRLFPAVEDDGGLLYLTDTTTAQAQIAMPYGTNLVSQNFGQATISKDHPFIISSNYWQSLANGTDTNYLLFDVVSGGSGKLVLSIYASDGVTKLKESQPLYLNLSEITNMYESWTVGDGNGGTPYTTAIPYSPFQYTSASPETDQYILFVHGWNVSPQVKDEFANTAYKRLWWQGYKGRFGAFRWPTLYNFPSWNNQGLNLRNFDDSESNAWASATGLVGLLADLNAQYDNSVYVFAHSHGNVVVGEALRLAGTDQLVNTYIACQAAVSAHAYDPSTSGWESKSSTPDSFANYPTDGNPCYFNGMTGAETRADFYNSNDWALNIWTLDQRLKPDHGLNYPGYFWSADNGYYKIAGTGPIHHLNFQDNTYEIFAYCVQSPCYALGATPNVNGFTMQNMPSLWPPDPFQGNDYSTHPWHSAEFLFSTADQWNFWKALMDQFGLPTNN
jgi:hypothetical protein